MSLSQKNFKAQLKANNACADGYAYVCANGLSLAEFWAQCARPDWMVWVLRRFGGHFNTPSHSDYAAIAVRSAESVQHLITCPEIKRVAQNAIDAAKAVIENPTDENTDAAADATSRAAWAAADAASRAAWAAADASRAAWVASRAAWVARVAVDAASRAAWAADVAADVVDAADIADYIRKIITLKREVVG